MMNEQWRMRVHSAEDSSYEQIHIQNKVFPHWLISFIEFGSVEVLDAQIVNYASDGHVMIHAPGIPFGEIATRPGRHKWMQFDLVNEYGVDLFRLYPVQEVIKLSDPHTFSQKMDEIIHTLEQPQLAFKEIYINSLALQVIFSLLQDWLNQGRKSRQSTFMKQDERLDIVVRYLFAHAHEKIAREQLAELVHLHPNYLDRIFHEKYQMKPMQMLRDIRLHEARRMLEGSPYNLTEIAEKCGLGDVSYFSKKFLHRFGVNPGQYRKENQQLQKLYV
jgi:AraC-like DNA-binding protein